MIAVETRTIELSIPADPAYLDSEAKVSVAMTSKYCCYVIGIMTNSKKIPMNS